jgi:hypothetical protein
LSDVADTVGEVIRARILVDADGDGHWKRGDADLSAR